MKNIFFVAFLSFLSLQAFTQDDVYPAKENRNIFFITNATIHVGNGQVITNAVIKINNGKIEQVGQNIPVPPATEVKIIDVKGKQVYPGLILSNTNLGLREIGNGAKGSNDYREIGEINANIRSIVAYNTDSKIIGTLRTNGVLLAAVSPQGGLISGSSSIVQLDAWNWEDAVYKMENGIHFNMPDFINTNPYSNAASQADIVKEAMAQIEKVKSFFREAKAYNLEANHTQLNLKYEAVKGLFEKKQKLFIHADMVKQMLIAIRFAQEFAIDVVIIGAAESWQIADLLKQNDIAVILNQEHSLPVTIDDDIDQPYKTPSTLQKAGVLFSLNDDNDMSCGRNLAFNAGTAVAYGLTKEEALQAITLNAAKILGIADKTGSIEVGKDANIIISEGDVLDMKTSIITNAFIQGRIIPLIDKQKELYERYKYKYELK